MKPETQRDPLCSCRARTRAFLVTKNALDIRFSYANLPSMSNKLIYFRDTSNGNGSHAAPGAKAGTANEDNMDCLNNVKSDIRAGDLPLLLLLSHAGYSFPLTISTAPSLSLPTHYYNTLHVCSLWTAPLNDSLRRKEWKEIGRKYVWKLCRKKTEGERGEFCLR